jgi:hypothetical protein
MRTRLVLAVMWSAVAASLCGDSGQRQPPRTRDVPEKGQTFYVAPAGHDDNPGTRGEPFRTSQRAADVVSPGDTVLVDDGVYTGTGENTPCASHTSRPVVCLTRGGDGPAWVTFRSIHPGGARIDGQHNASTSGFMFLVNANYIEIDGFEIFGSGNAAQAGSGIELFSGGHDVTLTRNHIHDIGRLCTDTTNGQTAIFVEQPRVTITRNVIHDIGRFAPGEQDCSPSQAYYRNHDHGVYVDGRQTPGADDIVIANNLFYNHRRGWAIQVYPGQVRGLSILNNTFAAANPYSPGQILLGASTRDARIVNNVFVDPLNAGITYFGGSHTNLTMANNLSSHALLDREVAGASMWNNVEYVDPRLAEKTYRPLADSPVIDRGLRLPDVRVDLDGVARPQNGAWDIGAYEFTKNPR